MASVEQEVALGVASAAGWGLVYAGARRVMQHYGKGDKSGEWACRAVCVGHALSACILSAIDNFYFGPLAYYAIGLPNNRLQTVTVQASLGYFCFDLAWCSWTGGETLSVLGHHLISIAVCVSTLALRASGAEVLGTLFGAEISNPLLQLRWFLVDSGMRGTRAHRRTEIAFALVFLFCRILWAPTLLVAVWRSERPHALIKFGAVGMQAVSWIWAYFVWKKLLRVLRGKEGAAWGKHE